MVTNMFSSVALGEILVSATYAAIAVVLMKIRAHRVFDEPFFDRDSLVASFIAWFVNTTLIYALIFNFTLKLG